MHDLFVFCGSFYISVNFIYMYLMNLLLHCSSIKAFKLIIFVLYCATYCVKIKSACCVLERHAICAFTEEKEMIILEQQ